MPRLRAVAVFCGSREGNDPAFRTSAFALGRGLAEAGLRLVYGGGGIGLMRALADGALSAGGAVTGVMPAFLRRLEVAHPGVADLITTESMHRRKQIMADLADAFVALPGALGTLDETVEILTWRQLGLHGKPVLACDIAGSAAPLAAAIETAIAQGFAAPGLRGMLEVVAGVPAVLARLAELATAPL
ncbi:MAG: TIGR00730 family Rossman fold protein [Rhodospirillales bacterium]|nr:TIGR00730 family Rossman fold protein [Rhodospirillales bacterium]